MSSTLIITSVETLQKEIISVVSLNRTIPGIYVSLNKTQKSAEIQLRNARVDTNKIFFIDCVTSEQTRDDVLHIRPNDLDKLSFSIETFIKDIPGEKYIIIDALSTLLIYNNENNVAAFVKKITEIASSNNVRVIALSPRTKGEELLNKIFNFFDEVKKR